MNKTVIKSFAVKARRQLLDAVRQKAYEHGITEKSDKGQCRQLSERISEKGYSAVMEEAAYTWFNRFIALRFMEANGYLPSKIRVFTDESGAFRPEILKEALTAELSGADKGKVLGFIENQENEKLYRYLLVAQCNELSECLPWLFDKESEWADILLPDNLLSEDSVLGKMISEIEEEEFKGSVEIIGWLYQYYISEKHDETVNVYKGTVKKEDIPAATQLFTTDWIVRYMVDNSLGRYWIERHPESPLREKLEYLVTPKSGKIPCTNEDVRPQNLTLFDPCMGSGHILVYAFEVLMEIYRECGYSERDAAEEIVKNNLYGADIDDRCTQLACFALVMKARGYDRRFLEKKIAPNLVSLKESDNAFIEMPDKEQSETCKYLVDIFSHSKETGSLIRIESRDYDAFTAYLDNYTDTAQKNEAAKLRSLAVQAKLLSGKYAVVCTNPPYLGKTEGWLKEYINSEYKPYSNDLFSVFVFRNFEFCIDNGYTAYMTPFVWMFIRSYENLRRFIIENKSIVSLVQLEYSAYEDAAVPVCAFVVKNEKSRGKALCCRLSEFKGGMEIQKKMMKIAAADPECGFVYEISQTDFLKISGIPIAYWANENIIRAFENEKTIGDVASVKIGMGTGKNALFLRNWWETAYPSIDFSLTSVKDLANTGGRWFPYNKGGDYRLWYGNLQEVIWFDKEGREKLKEMSGYRENGGYEYYFQKGITWTFISSSKFGVRCRPCGSVFDVAGSTLFVDEEKFNYLLAFLASKVSGCMLKMLNPTMNCQAGNIKSLPIIFEREGEAERIAAENIELSKQDWDSFETSYDFKRHPLV